MPITRRGRVLSAAKPAIIPACVEPVTVQTTIVSKKTPSSLLLLLDLVRPSWRSPGRRAGGRTRRPGSAYGVPPRGLDLVERLLPAAPEADVEAGVVEPHVGAHDPRQQDVADPVVDGVGPVDPASPAPARHFSPSCAATAATWRVWLDW